MLVLFPVMRFLIGHPDAATLIGAVAALSILHAHERRGRDDSRPAHLSTCGALDGPVAHLLARRRIFGGTATYIVTWLDGVIGDPLASTYYVMAANVVMLLAVLGVS